MFPLTQSLNARSKHQLSAFCGAALMVIIFLSGTTSAGSLAGQRGVPGRAVRLARLTRWGACPYHSFGSDHRTNKFKIAEERMNTEVPAPFYDVLRKTL